MLYLLHCPENSICFHFFGHESVQCSLGLLVAYDSADSLCACEAAWY